MALVGLALSGCSGDVVNPFNQATEGSSGTGGSGTGASGGDDGQTSQADGTGTGSADGTGTTMGLDDTAGSTAAGSTSVATTGNGETGTTGSVDTGGSTGGGSSTGTTGTVDNHVYCPGGDIPNDMGFPVSVTGSSSMQSSEFSGSCGGGGAPDYTWTFTAPYDGDFLFDTNGSSFDTVLYILDGECTGPELICNDDGIAGTNTSLAGVSLLQDQEVTAVVDAFGLTGGPITLTVREGTVACPADALDTVPVTVSGQNTVATADFAGSCGGGDSNDTEYTFVAPQDGTYTFEITNNTFDTIMYLLDGHCMGTELICNDNIDASGSGASGFTYPLAMGDEVTVVVDGFFGGSGTFDLNIDVLTGTCPDEDLGNMAVPWTVTGATTGEDNATAGSCGGLASADYAYTWTAPEAATYRFTTENTDFDTVVYVEDGNDCLGTELGCNNDSIGTDGSTTATVIQDQTITIIVDGNGAEGNYDLTATVECPSQDMGSTVPNTVTDQTTVATDQFSPSCGTGGAQDQGITFTAPADGTYVFETTNNDFDTVLAAFDGVCAGSELACNDNLGGSASGESGFSLGLSAGQEITLVVEGYFGATGTTDITVAQLSGTCPDEDLGDTGVPFTTSGDTSMEDNGMGGSCGGLTSNDYSYTWTAPASGLYRFSTEMSAYNTVLYLNDTTCTGAELSCNDDAGAVTTSEACAELTMGQQVVVTVDGNGASGAYDLLIEDSSTDCDCCYSHNSIGCAVASISSCVCALDGFCCSSSWDSICAGEAVTPCGATCV